LHRHKDFKLAKVVGDCLPAPSRNMLQIPHRGFGVALLIHHVEDHERQMLPDARYLAGVQYRT